MLRRIGRPGLLGTVARTAVIAGTATMTTSAIRRAGSRRQAEHEAYEQQQPAVPAAVPQYQPAADPPAGDLVDKLAQLAQLRDSGALSGAEFEAAKAKLLG